MRCSQRGTSYLEALAAVVLLGIVLVSSGGIILRRHAVSERLRQHSLALEAVSSERDAILANGGAALGQHVFRSRADATCGLPGARGRVLVSRHASGLTLVRVELSWRGHTVAREVLLRGKP